MHENSNSNLQKNLKTVIGIMGCTNTDIAAYAGCSASNISRIRSGSRTYSKDSKTVKCLVAGIYEYASAYGYLDRLCSLIDCKRKDSVKDMQSALAHWLFKNNIYSDSISYETINHKLARFRFFGEKLNAIMDMLELSNVKLGKAISIDPSYISRLRNGVRTPKRNHALNEDIAQYLIDRIIEQNKQKQLSRMMNVSFAATNDEAYIKNAFLKWLTDSDSKSNESAVENFLENIDRFTPAIPKILPEMNDIIDSFLLDDKSDEYIGIKGLQSAVVRFLSNVISKKAEEIWLYSDQDMVWITENREYLLAWTFLLGACVKHRIKIKIIHTIDRDADEMISGLESWIPLYMSGMIEPYYCRKRSDLRFSHSLFICPKTVCVESYNVKGSENTGIYRYHEDEMHLMVYQDQFDSLLSYCEPLMKIYTQSDLAKYIFYTDSMFSKSGIITMLNSLSIAFMPNETLDSMLKKVQLTDEEKENIYAFHSNRKNLYNNAFRAGKASDIIPLPKPADVEEGKVSLNLENIRSGLRIPYTKEEYMSHVRSVLDALRTNTGYNLINLPEMPFLNVQIILNGDIVTVVKSNTPHIAFVISNPFLTQAFKDYTKKLLDKYYQGRSDIEQKLSEYLV